MATSGVVTWELDVIDLVGRAYAKLGIPGEGNTLTATQQADGITALNMAIQLAVVDGMSIWKRTTLDVTPSATVQDYPVTSASKITAVYLEDDGGTQYELLHKSLYDFMRLPTTAGPSVPVHWTFSQSIQGYTVSIWPPTSDSVTIADKTIRIVYQKEFDSATDTADETLDFPAYWHAALTYRTAQLLAPEYGVPLPDRGLLTKEADMLWDQAKGYDDEDGSLYITPSPWMRDFKK